MSMILMMSPMANSPAIFVSSAPSSDKVIQNLVKTIYKFSLMAQMLINLMQEIKREAIKSIPSMVGHKN